MTNLPPEHRNPAPDEEPNPEPTGSFPVADEDEYMRPPSVSPQTENHEPIPPSVPSPAAPPQPGYSEPTNFDRPSPDAQPPPSDYQQPPPPPQNPPERRFTPQRHPATPPEPTATGQFPAFTDRAANQPGPGPQGAAFAPSASEQGGQAPSLEDYQAESSVSRDAIKTEPDQPIVYETRQIEEVAVGPLPDPVESFDRTMQSSVAFPDEPEAWEKSGGPPVPEPEIQVSGVQAAVLAPHADEPKSKTETSDVDLDLPPRVQRRLAKKTEPDTRLQQLRSERDSDSGWSYLAALGILFALLVVFSFGCGRLANADRPAARNAQLVSDVGVSVVISGDQVSVTGTLPDEGKATQLVALVAEHYDPAQISNNLQVDSDISVDDSVVRISGQAAPEDSRPADLEAKLAANYEIPVSVNSVEFGALPENLVAVEVKVEGASVALTGMLPDQGKLDLVKGAAESVWGADKADSSGLALGSVVWEGGRITVSGNILGSVKPGQFADQVKVEGIFIDAGEDVDAVSNATPDEIKAAVAQQIEATPINFDAGNKSLSDANKKTVESMSKLLLALPTDEAITIVGYGDGGAGSTALGKDRAGIVFSELTSNEASLSFVDFEGSDGSSPSQITIRFD